MAEWSMQDARAGFDALIDDALAGEPQHVTRRGQPAAVVLAMDEYERLCRLEKADVPTLGELLVGIPQDDHEFDRLSLTARPLRDEVTHPTSPTASGSTGNASD